MIGSTVEILDNIPNVILSFYCFSNDPKLDHSEVVSWPHVAHGPYFGQAGIAAFISFYKKKKYMKCVNLNLTAGYK